LSFLLLKLLRVLQEREYEPLGGTTPVKTNIRIIAATNGDLKKSVAQAKFRDDLYFRLAVVKFTLPFLKERREDIPYLVDHFIKRFNAKTGKKIISVSPEVMNILMSYDYPGNIRELENIIEHGFVLCRNSIIQKEHLPLELTKTIDSSTAESDVKSSPILESINTQTRIISALRANDGNISKAALNLGIHRTTLWRKIKRFNIDLKQL